MKQLLMLIAIVSLVFLACNKAETIDSSMLDGTWKMVSVQDRRLGSTINNPGNQGEVVIKLRSINTANGVLTGRTPSNDIGPDTFTVSTNRDFNLPSLFSTKVGETAWGNLFFDNILQTNQYTFKGSGRMILTTANGELSFDRQ